MTDIVKILRAYLIAAGDSEIATLATMPIREAADEIERLRCSTASRRARILAHCETILARDAEIERLRKQIAWLLSEAGRTE